MKNSHKGIGLTETTIVLTAIGLLTTGVFSLSAFLESAHMASIIKQMQDTKSACDVFYNLYKAIPGDFFEASYSIPHDSKCNHEILANVEDVEGGTFNGNGNNKIDSPTADTNESYWAWCHLYLAGTGFSHYEVPASNTSKIIPGVHTPKTKKNAAYGLIYMESFNTNGTKADNIEINDNILMIHKPNQNNTTNDLINKNHANGGLRISRAKNIIKKIDDSKPHKGQILIANANYANNSSSTCINTSSTFNILKGDLCILIYKLQIIQ